MLLVLSETLAPTAKLGRRAGQTLARMVQLLFAVILLILALISSIRHIITAIVTKVSLSAALVPY